MGFFCDDKDARTWPSPEEKEEFVSLYRSSCPHHRSLLFENAEVFGILPDLVEKAKAIDDDKSRYILSTVNLMKELKKLLADDDGDKFFHFLTVNRDFVLSFPVFRLFRLCFFWGPSPNCGKVLLHSSFAVHLDVNQFSHSSGDGTPLVAAGQHLCLPLVQTLLHLGADVHRTNVLSHITPLAAAITTLRRKYFTSNESITGIFYKLSRTNLKEAVNVIHLLASASRTDLNKILNLILMFLFDWVKLTLLLVIAQPLLLCPNDAWSIENTPASRFLSSIESSIDPTKVKFMNGYPINKARINEARTVVTSVWESSQNLCKMHFILRLIPSSGVEEPFPEVMSDFFEQYIDAHSFEAYIPRKRARNEA